MKRVLDKNEKVVYPFNHNEPNGKRLVLIESGEYLKRLDDWIVSTRINMHNDFE